MIHTTPIFNITILETFAFWWKNDYNKGMEAIKKHTNANFLKVIAILAMTIDHAADLLFPNFSAHPAAIVMHLIGRITAPVMFFFICEGFFYTKNLKKYVLRTFIFAILSHFAYCFAFGIPFVPFMNGSVFNQTSIMWGLAWSVVALYVVHGQNKLKEWQKTLLFLGICVITFPADWSCISVLAITFMYKFRSNAHKQFAILAACVIGYAVVSFFFVNRVYALLQLGVILAYPLLLLYNGQKGKANWLKWFFYAYYPAHLVVVGVIRLCVYGNIPIL